MSKVILRYSDLVKKIDGVTNKSNTIKIEPLEKKYKVTINKSVMYLSKKYYTIVDDVNVNILASLTWI